MISGVLQIDQTPCRASYGLLTPSALQQQLAGQQRAEVLGDIAEIVEDGNRLAKAYNGGNTMPQMASEKYGYNPPDVVLASIDRPVIRWQETSGGIVDILA